MLKNESSLLFGTKIYNHKTKEIGLIIKTWDNTFSINGGGFGDVPFVTCVDIKGKRYNTAMEDTTPIEDLDDEELQKLGLNK